MIAAAQPLSSSSPSFVWIFKKGEGESSERKFVAIERDMAGMEMDDLAENFGRCLKSLVDEGSIVSRRYYLSRRTVLEMLRDRGYLVPDAELELTLQEFRDKYTQDPDVSRLRISALHKDDPSNKVSCSIGLIFILSRMSLGFVSPILGISGNVLLLLSWWHFQEILD